MFKETVLHIDRIGIIKSDEENGCQIRICKAERGNGFYLFISDDFSNPKNPIGDHYYDSLEDILECFVEDCWEIEWV